MHEITDPDDDGKIVKLSARDVQDARRLLSMLSKPGGRTLLIESPTDAEARSWESRERLVQRARYMLDDRRIRGELFGVAMFGEPAWDIMLALYVAENGPRKTISRLASVTGSSRTTALRWLDYLEQQQLVRRENHPTDRRTAFVELTEKGKERLDLYFTQVLRPPDSI